MRLGFSSLGKNSSKRLTWCYIWANKVDSYSTIKRGITKKKIKSYHCHHKVLVFLLYPLYAEWNCFYSLRKMDTWLTLLFANAPSLNEISLCEKKYFMFVLSFLVSKQTFSYLFKFNNGNTSNRCKICSKLIKKTPKRGHWCRSGVFIVNFQHILHFVLVFLLLILNR